MLTCPSEERTPAASPDRERMRLPRATWCLTWSNVTSGRLAADRVVRDLLILLGGGPAHADRSPELRSVVHRDTSRDRENLEVHDVGDGLQHFHIDLRD